MQVPRYWRMKQHLYRLTAVEVMAEDSPTAEAPVKTESASKQPIRSAEPMPAKYAIVA